MIKPRDYQVAGHEATWNYIHAHPDKNPLVVEPTGTGKSMQMSMLIWHLLTQYPHLRILSVTHVKELIESNYKELLGLWPGAPAGIYSAGLGSKDHRQQVTFCGIMSVAKKAPLFGKVDFMLVDEAHTISDASTAAYNKFIAGLKERNPNLVVIGYTATDFRAKMGKLTEGDLFDEVCFDMSGGDAFVWLIEQGYLCSPVPKDPGFQLDSDAIAITTGDFDNRQTSDALRDQDILERAVDHIIAVGQNRKAWLHFCQSIEDAELVAEMFTHKGYPHEAVHSKRADRDDVLAAFRRGDLRGVTNKDVLTTGYNQKNIDLMGVLRLTRSPGLWVQMVGRGTRPDYAPGYDLTTRQGRLDAIAASGKQTCLVLDFVGNTPRLGPINYPVVPKRRKPGGGGGTGIVRTCPQCGAYSHPSVKTCIECGHEFPPPKRIQDKASDAALVARGLDLTVPPPPAPEKVYEVAGVHRMVATRHQGKNGKPDSVKITYYCERLQVFNEWLCFDHPARSFPHNQAVAWWHKHMSGVPVPAGVGAALELADAYVKPKFIKVEVSQKYPKVVGHDMRGTRFELPPEAGGPPLAEPEPDPLQAKPLSPQQESRWGEMSATWEDEEIPF